MNSNDTKKKTKRPKHKNSLTTNTTEITKSINRKDGITIGCDKNQCPLIAKDSEWVDILESTSHNTKLTDSFNKPAGEEVQIEDDSQIKPMALMFPNLLDEDPLTLEGIVNKAISTTEVTRHLVGHKANFSFLRKVDRLIQPDKEWLERLSEKSNSNNSLKITEDETMAPRCTGTSRNMDIELKPSKSTQE